VLDGPDAPRWAAWTAIAVAAGLAFARGVPHALLDGWDDDRFLLENELVQRVSLDHLASFFTEPHFQAYHPLHLLSYWLDVPWLGTDGPGIHAVSLVLWIFALVAVYEAGRALGLGFVGAMATTLLVGLHPVQVEAVTWATGRKDILALGFSALAVIFHCRARGPFDRWRAASLLAFSAAALSKTSALPLPLVLLAADLVLRERDWKRSLLGVAPFLLVAASLGALTIAIWSGAEMTRSLDVGGRVALVLATLTHHLETIFFPSSLSPLYPVARDGGFSLAQLALGPVVLAATGVAAWRWRSRPLAFALIAFLLLVAPVSNAIPLYFQWQDRYLSLPLWPVAFAVGYGLQRLSRVEGPRWPAWAALAVLVGALGLRTVQYAGRWSDALTLFGHAAATQPESFYAWLNLGHSRLREGHLDSASAAYDQAIEVANLRVAHDARFRAQVLIDERNHDLSPSRADELTARFHGSFEDVDALRRMAVELAGQGYRRAVMLALDYSFARDPIGDERLERAALIQLERGHEWLCDYYLSRMTRRPITPLLVERVGPAPTSP